MTDSTSNPIPPKPKITDKAWTDAVNTGIGRDDESRILILRGQVPGEFQISVGVEPEQINATIRLVRESIRAVCQKKVN